MVDYIEKSIDLHKKLKGKLEIISRVDVDTKEDLATAYSPGVAGPCLEIQTNPELYKDLVSAGSTIAVISDGSAVLGLGDIGPKAAMPVMEGKCVLFKKFGDLNAFPIVVGTQNVDEFIKTVKNIAPSFAGINLEDISAPRCFEIEERLKQELDIPVFHDDQHGTAIVTLAGLINYLKISNKDLSIRIVVNGAGAAGIAITKLLYKYGFKNIVVCDSVGVICKDRENLTPVKLDLLNYTNASNICGSVFDVLKYADVFIAVSKGNLLTAKNIETMNKDPAIFAMANPTPEIMPDEAKKGGALVVGTGRSDFPNQLNNVLVFPGIFKGALISGARMITDEMKIAAAKGLADLVETPNSDKIIPSPFDKGVADAVAKAVIDEYKKNL